MKNKIISSVLSQTLVMVISGIVAIVTVPILINMLGKINYGTFELIASLAIIAFLLEFGMGSTLVKFIPEYKYEKSYLHQFIWSYFYVKLFVTFLGCGAIVLVGYYFDSLFQLEEVKDIALMKTAVYIFALSIFLTSISTFLINILKGFVYFGSVNLARTLSIVQFFIIFYLYYLYSSDYDIVTVAILWFMLRHVITIFNVLFLINRYNLLYLLIPTKFKYETIKQTLKYLFGMSYITFVAQLYNALPKIILGAISGPIYVAYWGIMDRVKKPLLDLRGSLLRPLIPILSDKKVKELSTETIFQASRLNYVFISFLGLVILVNIKLFIQVWIGNDFNEVIPLIEILLLPFIYPTAGVLLMIYYSKGKTKINQIFLTLNTSISLSLATVLFILFDEIIYFVAAYTFTIMTLTSIFLFIYIHYFKLNSFQYVQKVLLPTLIPMILSYVGSRYLIIYYPEDVVGLLLGVISTALLYLTLTYLFMPEEDKKLTHSLISKLKRKKSSNA